MDAGSDADGTLEDAGVCVLPLSCAQGECTVDYAPSKYPVSCVPGSILMEGVCSGARYRVSSDGYGEETFYWNDRTGKLLGADWYVRATSA